MEVKIQNELLDFLRNERDTDEDNEKKKASK